MGIRRPSFYCVKYWLFWSSFIKISNSFLEIQIELWMFWYSSEVRAYNELIGHRNHTILPTPGDPTNMTLSTEDTNASPVSANLGREAQSVPQIENMNMEQKGKRKGKTEGPTLLSPQQGPLELLWQQGLTGWSGSKSIQTNLHVLISAGRSTWFSIKLLGCLRVKSFNGVMIYWGF